MRIGADPHAENNIGQSPAMLANMLLTQGKVLPSFVDALDPDEYIERRDHSKLIRRREALLQEQNLALQEQLRERYRGTSAAKAVFQSSS
jgi:hypothetical protein